MSFIFLIIGLILLVKGADLLVQGASSIAKYLNVSDLVVGLTVVAFGTSMPELIVNISASLSGSTDIAIGNVLGSNVCNILLILGITAIVHPIHVQKSTIMSEIPFALIAIAVLGFFVNVSFFDMDGDLKGLGRFESIALLIFMGMFMYYIFYISKEQVHTDEAQQEGETGEKILKMPMWKSILFVGLGLVGLIVGGELVVRGAVLIAQMLKMSESFIGLTVVAVGTSLPELVTSVMAAYRKNSDIAIGNVVGSNIFNIFTILGITGLITPLPFSQNSNFDISAVIVSTVLLILVLPVGKKGKIDRLNGVFFLLCYIAYTYYLVMRG
jgi:cation:H+ antiporter